MMRRPWETRRRSLSEVASCRSVRIVRLLVIGCAALLCLPQRSALAESRRLSWDFETETPGQAAVGFARISGRWEAMQDAGNLVFAQRAENRENVLNIALIEATSYKDLDLSVRLKPIGGENERGGGLIWRAKDKDNFYAVRLCPYIPKHNRTKTANLRLYKMEAGRLTQLDHADAAVDDEWHTLRITMTGSQIVGYLDGRRALEAEDASNLDVGRIGLWTRSDACTSFDDLTVSAP